MLNIAEPIGIESMAKARLLSRGLMSGMGWRTWRWAPTSRGQIKELRTMTWDRTTETKVHEGT
jgi:hypothetical protein